MAKTLEQLKSERKKRQEEGANLPSSAVRNEDDTKGVYADAKSLYQVKMDRLNSYEGYQDKNGRTDLVKLKKMRKAGYFSDNYDTDGINNWYNTAQTTLKNVADNINKNAYSYAMSEDSTNDAKTLADLEKESDYINSYLSQNKNSDLSSLYKAYSQSIADYKQKIYDLQGASGRTNSEDDFNNAVNKNSLQKRLEEKYKNSLGKYNLVMDDVNNSSSDEEELSKMAAYVSGDNEYSNLMATDTVPSKEQIEQYNKDSEAIFKAEMSKYDNSTYDELMKAYNNTDSYREKQWLENKALETASSSDLQNEIDKLGVEYDSLYNGGTDIEKDKRRDDIEAKIEELDSKIKNKKNEEDKEENYSNVILNDVKAHTALQKYYALQKADETEKLLNDTGASIEDIKTSSAEYYNYAKNLSEGEKAQIVSDFENLKNQGYDVDKLYKYFSREQEEKLTDEQNKILTDYAQEHPVLGSVASVSLNIGGGVADATKYIGTEIDSKFNNGDGYINAKNTNVYKAQAVRDTVSEDMGGLGKFLYSTGMSMADFLSTAAMSAVPGGQAAGLALLGTSAGVSAANDVIESGGDIDHAVKTGIAAGIAETFFEKVSLEQLKAFKQGDVNSVRDFVKNLIKGSFTEGSEEAFTDMANAITDQIINGDMSQLSWQYNNYLASGMSEREAWWQTALGFSEQTMLDFAGGALSGGVMSGGAMTINVGSKKVSDALNGADIKENKNVNSLIDTAKTLSADSKAYKLASQLEEKQKNNKKISSSKVGQLRELTIQQSSAEYKETYKKATESLHEDEKAILDKIALKGENLTPEEISAVKSNDVLANSINEVQKARNNSQTNRGKAIKSTFASIDDNTDDIDESKLKISDNGISKIDGSEYTGTMEIVNTDPNTETVTYKIEKNGKIIEVDSDNIEFKSKEEAKLNALASKYDIQTAQKFFDLYESGMDVDEYSREFNLYQNYGRLAIELTDDKMNTGYLLNNNQKIEAYQAGLTSRKSYYQEQNIIASNAKNSKYYAYTKGNFNAFAIKDIQLDETQRAFYNFFREFALRTGINVELFSSKEKSGKYQGEQGSWNKNTKTIRVDINAGLMSVSDRGEIKHGMLNTFSHELTHIAESSGFYDELHEAIVSTLEKRGTNFDEIAGKKKEQLRSNPKTKPMSDEELTYLADVEVIADCCETMLKDSKIFEDIAQGNPTLAQKLKDKLKNFIARLKQLLNKTNALTAEGKLLEECVTDFEEIQKIWDKAVTDGIKAVNAEQKNSTVQNNEQYQLRGYSEKQIDNWSNSKNIIIYKTDSQLSVFIDDALAGKNLNQKMYFGTIDQQLANRIYNDTNVNVEGFNVVLRASEIRKILLYSHGNESKENARGQRAITKEDILLIPNIISEPDKIVNAGQTKSNKPAIAFEKTIKGKTTVLSYVSDKHMDLTVQTMYSGKEKSLPTTADAKSPASTPETNSGTASNNSIFNATENVNNDTKKFSKEISNSGVNDNIEYQSRSSLSYDRDLVAIHNLSAENLLNSINLGGFAMPSIAITKSELQHNDYGKISLIFSKDTIDPETDESNEVYSGDAWTPTFPKIEYKINERKSSKIYDKLYSLFKNNNIERVFYGLDIDDNNIEYYINNRSNWIQTYRDKSEMKLAYLLDTGKPINMPYKESRLSSKYENDVIINVADTLGFDVVEKGLEYSDEAVKLTDKINSIVDDYYSKETGKSIHFDLGLSDVDSILHGAYKYLRRGNNREIDTYALEKEIKKTDIDEKNYYKWIDNLFDGIIEKNGLRNNRDLFTSLGNRRSFESLHYEVTLENVVKAMKGEDKKGAVGIFGGSQFYGSSTKNYNSVSEIKKNERRLQSLSKDEYDEIRYGFNERLSEICRELNPEAENSFIEVDNTASIICDAVKNRKTKSGIKRYLSMYQQLTVNDEIVDKIISLVNDIRQMPVKYFEAKPRRAVSFDEVKAAVIPADTDNAVKEALKKLGVPMYEYDSNNENSRAEVTQKAINTEYVDINGEKHSDLLFQMRPDSGFANRRLLANALENSVQNNYERNKLKLYKDNIDQIDELEARLEDVKQKAKSITSVKAKDRTREQRTELMKLNNREKILRDQIIRKDKQLLNLESMDVMKKLIESEKKKAKHETRISYKAQLKEVRESKNKIIVAEREKRKTMVKGVRDARDKKEIIRKTQKVLKDIDKLLNHSKADKTVKQGLRKTASKVLAFLDTNISNADIVKQGVESATPEEQKMLQEYKRLLGVIDSKTPELQKYTASLEKSLAKRNDLNIYQRSEMLKKDVKLKREELIGLEREKVHQLNSQLKDVFSRERERLTRIPIQQALTELSEAYKETKNAPEAYIRNAFDDNIIEAIDSFKNEIGGTLVKDMNVAQAQELYKIVTMIQSTLRNANKLFAEDMKLTCEQTSKAVMQEIINVRSAKELRNLMIKKVSDFQWKNLKPVYAFRFIGSKTFEKLYWNLQKGEQNWYIDLAEAKQFKEKQERKYAYKSFDFKKTFEFTAMDGSTFTLDLNQMMDIYVASRRPQALQHLLKGGFTFEKDSPNRKLKVKTGAKAYPLTMETIQNIASGLSENEKGYAESMQKYLSETMAKKGNEVSMALYGAELFKEDTYWSISSSDTFLQVEENETTGEFKLKNSGFTKSTIRNASNPIVLKGFEENWCNHVNQMSLYHAMTLPLEDFTKVFNYNTGARTSEENPTAVTGVRSVIKGAFGNSAESYIRQFLRDLNGGVREASRVGIADNLISLSKKAAVFANLSVVLQQPSAVFRATAYVDKRYFLPEVNKLVRLQNHHKDWEQLKKYAPIAGIKEMGMFDTGTGKGVLEWLSSGKRDSVIKKTQNKIDDIGSLLPAKADEYAWIKLWHAIQRETRAKHGLAIGTEENLVKSGERFNEVVHLTQVYDSVFSRSGAMRSSQTFDKMATSFMAEPTTIMNMAFDSAVQWKRSGFKSGIKQFTKSTTAILTSIFANALLKSLASAGRDDDKDETYEEKYWQAFWSDIINSVNPLTYYPITRDIMSIIEGYTTERMDMSLVSDFVISLKKLMKEDGTTTDNMIDFVGYIANLFGLPVRNVVRDFKAGINTYNTLTTASKDPITNLEMSMPTDYQEAYDKYWQDGYTEDDCESKAASSVKTKIRKKLRPVYIEALKNQDSATVASIRRYMRDSGFYESLNGVDKALKNWRESSEEEEERAQRAEERK